MILMNHGIFTFDDDAQEVRLQILPRRVGGQSLTLEDLLGVLTAAGVVEECIDVGLIEQSLGLRKPHEIIAARGVPPEEPQDAAVPAHQRQARRADAALGQRVQGRGDHRPKHAWLPQLADEVP